MFLRVITYLAEHKLTGFLLSLLLGVLVGVATVQLVEIRVYDDNRADLAETVERVKYSLLQESVDCEACALIR